MVDLSVVPTDDLLAELGRRCEPEPIHVHTAEGHAFIIRGQRDRLRWAYVGNFDGVPHSTENEYRKALLAEGHEVIPMQESKPGNFDQLATRLRSGDIDIVLWTRTRWPRMDFAEMRRMLTTAREVGVPTVGVHLDVWWGLPRSSEIGEHPFFEVDLLCTADGGHDQEWANAGIEHVWMPPGVSAEECVPARSDPRYEADVAFIGSWQDYHPEHPHRAELVAWLQRHGARFWPEPGQHAVRGEALRRLYATTKVNVGDSCFVGTGLPRYCSDRIPETLGRGGFLIHPRVPGVTDGTLYTEGEHLVCWEAGDWVELGRMIDHYLHHPAERFDIAEAGRAHVLAHHTYANRVRELVEIMRDRHLIPKDRGVAA